MTVVTVQVPKRSGDKKQLQHFYRVEVDGTSDEAILVAVKAILADRDAHEIGKRKKLGQKS